VACGDVSGIRRDSVTVGGIVSLHVRLANHVINVTDGRTDSLKRAALVYQMAKLRRSVVPAVFLEADALGHVILDKPKAERSGRIRQRSAFPPPCHCRRMGSGNDEGEGKDKWEE